MQRMGYWMSSTKIDRRTLMAGGIAAAAVASQPVFGRAASSPVVTCAAGRFAGSKENGMSTFLGIRYGNAERFRAPVAVARSRDVVRANAYGPSCWQSSKRYPAFSEDPLFLNIWTPAISATAKKPVMLYIHGGAYSTGSAVDPLLDGRHLAAAGDAVVVTVNHRLNAFGYLYLARLDPRFPDSGNAGQLDLLLALDWVRENIAAFGGDPARVMVFGQSGGGAKISTFLGMPAATGLFHRAITMSGQQVTASGPLNATRRTQAFIGRLGVKDKDLSPLLTLPAEKLVEALQETDPILGGGIYFGPVLDMLWLKRHPFWPDANPISRSVPLVMGNTHDETRAFIPPNSPKLADLSWDNLPERVAPEMKVDALPEWVVAQFRARYPTWNAREIFWGITTAARSWRSQVVQAEARARADMDTWVYQVNFASPTEPERGAPHTMDIALAFGTLGAEGSFTGTGEGAQKASRALMNAFIAFAKTGDPNATGAPAWPQYRLDKRATMIIDADSRVEDNPRQWERELFASIPYTQPGT
jgi:para-nitrobenzyl esterase